MTQEKTTEDKLKDEEIKRGNFKLSKNGRIDYYVGWCGLEFEDIEDLKYLLAELELRKLKEEPTEK